MLMIFAWSCSAPLEKCSPHLKCPTGPGESYGRFGLLDFCKPFQDVCSFLPAPVGNSLKKHPATCSTRNFLNQLSGDVAFLLSLKFYRDVSENSATPKSSILIGFSSINHPFWGTTIFGSTHMLWVGPSFSNGNLSQRPSHGWMERSNRIGWDSSVGPPDSQKSDPKNPMSWKSLLRRHYENLKVFQKKDPHPMILGRILGKSWTSPPSFEWIAANCCCLSHWRHLVACRWLDWVLQKSGYASNFWVLRDWTTDSWVHAQSPSHLVIEFVFTSPFPSLQRCPLFCPDALERHRFREPTVCRVPKAEESTITAPETEVGKHRLAKKRPYGVKEGMMSSPFQFLHHHFHYKGTKDEKYWKDLKSDILTPPSFQAGKAETARCDFFTPETFSHFAVNTSPCKCIATPHAAHSLLPGSTEGRHSPEKTRDGAMERRDQAVNEVHVSLWRQSEKFLVFSFWQMWYTWRVLHWLVTT